MAKFFSHWMNFDIQVLVDLVRDNYLKDDVSAKDPIMILQGYGSPDHWKNIQIYAAICHLHIHDP